MKEQKKLRIGIAVDFHLIIQSRLPSHKRKKIKIKLRKKEKLNCKRRCVAADATLVK